MSQSHSAAPVQQCLFPSLRARPGLTSLAEDPAGEGDVPRQAPPPSSAASSSSQQPAQSASAPQVFDISGGDAAQDDPMKCENDTQGDVPPPTASPSQPDAAPSPTPVAAPKKARKPRGTSAGFKATRRPRKRKLAAASDAFEEMPE